ncbi:MAG: hypothetical protein ACKOXB_06265 [Flavobacteriales bacterium]
MDFDFFIALEDKNHVGLFARLFFFFLALQLLFNFPQQLRYFKTQPQRLYRKKVKILRLFSLPELTTTYFVLFGIMLLLSLILAAAGIYMKLFTALALLCYFPYFMSIISMPSIQRKTNLIPFVLLVLLVSPSVSESIDKPAPSWELLLIKIAIVQMYLSSAVQKLIHSGWRWCKGSTLQAHLMENYLWNEKKITLILAQNKGLCTALSYFTLLFELSFIILLFLPHLTYLYLSLALLFHLGTLLTMRINYLKYLLPVYMVFLTDMAFYLKNILENL